MQIIGGGGINGSAGSISVDTDNGDMYIGSSGYNSTNGWEFTGYMSDFRIYSRTLSITERATIFEEGPNGARLPRLDLSPWSTLIQVSWTPNDNATSYRLTIDSGSGEEPSVDSTTDLAAVIYNLPPQTSYTVRLYYSDDDTIYVIDRTATTTTRSESSSNSNTSLFNMGGVYDFTFLNKATQERLRNTFNDTIPSGSTVILDESQLDPKVLKNGNRFRVITRGSTSTIPENESVMIPFDTTEGASQSVTLELSDSTDVVVGFDETENNIVVGGETYTEGEHFVLDGKKVTVYDI